MSLEKSLAADGLISVSIDLEKLQSLDVNAIGEVATFDIDDINVGEVM